MASFSLVQFLEDSEVADLPASYAARRIPETITKLITAGLMTTIISSKIGDVHHDALKLPPPQQPMEGPLTTLIKVPLSSLAGIITVELENKLILEAELGTTVWEKRGVRIGWKVNDLSNAKHEYRYILDDHDFGFKMTADATNREFRVVLMGEPVGLPFL